MRSNELVSSLLNKIFAALELPRPQGNSKRVELTLQQQLLQMVGQKVGNLTVPELFSMDAVFPVCLDPAAEQGMIVYMQLYFAILKGLPASARQWFSEIRDRHLSGAIEQFTLKYLSPQLLADEVCPFHPESCGSRMTVDEANISLESVATDQRGSESSSLGRRLYGACIQGYRRCDCNVQV